MVTDHQFSVCCRDWRQSSASFDIRATTTARRQPVDGYPPSGGIVTSRHNWSRKRLNGGSHREPRGSDWCKLHSEHRLLCRSRLRGCGSCPSLSGGPARWCGADRGIHYAWYRQLRDPWPRHWFPHCSRIRIRGGPKSPRQLHCPRQPGTGPTLPFNPRTLTC